MVHPDGSVDLAAHLPARLLVEPSGTSRWLPFLDLAFTVDVDEVLVGRTLDGEKLGGLLLGQPHNLSISRTSTCISPEAWCRELFLPCCIPTASGEPTNHFILIAQACVHDSRPLQPERGCRQDAVGLPQDRSPRPKRTMAGNATGLGERRTAEAPRTRLVRKTRTHTPIRRRHLGYAERQTHVQTSGSYQHAQHLSPLSPRSLARFCG